VVSHLGDVREVVCPMAFSSRGRHRGTIVKPCTGCISWSSRANSWRSGCPYSACGSHSQEGRARRARIGDRHRALATSNWPEELVRERGHELDPSLGVPSDVARSEAGGERQHEGQLPATTLPRTALPWRCRHRPRGRLRRRKCRHRSGRRAGGGGSAGRRRGAGSLSTSGAPLGTRPKARRRPATTGR
jgi:hypothetical protein